MNGSELQEERKNLGLTRSEFAGQVGYTYNHIYKIETGQRKVPSVLVKFLEMFKKQTVPKETV